MEVFVHVFLMVVLVRLLVLKDRPWVYAGVYASVWLGLHLVLSKGEWLSMAMAFASAAAALAAAALFFGVLSRLDNALLWWGVALAGNMLVFVAGFVAAIGVNSVFA